MQEPPCLNFSDNVRQMLGFLNGHLLENSCNRLTICSLCILTICNISYLLFWL